MPRRKNSDKQVFIGLGANLNDKEGQILQALKMLEENACQILNTSSFYSTDPWGEKDQDDFLNLVCQISTKRSPWQLMELIKEIETKLKKIKTSKWGARTIDLDIIFYGGKIIFEKDLIIPHPNMYLRNFVLVPLLEIAPEFRHPLSGKTTSELMNESTDEGKVTLFSGPVK